MSQLSVDQNTVMFKAVTIARINNIIKITYVYLKALEAFVECMSKMYTVTITSVFFLYNRHGTRLILRWDGVRAGRAARGDWAGAAGTRLAAARPVLCSSENTAEFAENCFRLVTFAKFFC